ncbi:MAG: pyruvate kinase [bacterium]|nr:pyruvate kinase [bacterium]
MANSRAQIIATIGPASKDPSILQKMMDNQMDVARLNFSHGTHEEHAELIKSIRAAADAVGKKIPIIQDLSGPREKTSAGHQFRAGTQKTITPKDIDDLAFGLDQGIEYIALSYVGNASDVLELRELMQKHGQVRPIIAKIERPVAVDNIDAIIESADAIMVARGDLGSSLPIGKVPFVQAMIIKKCNEAKKPVITATQMLLSMVESPEPTRAEVSDVAHAILDGTDAVMLSEESAIGKHPIEAISIMEQIVTEAEKHLTGKQFNLL